MEGVRWTGQGRLKGDFLEERGATRATEALRIPDRGMWGGSRCGELGVATQKAWITPLL